MIAAIGSGNVASIKLREKFGFTIVGQINEVARKFSEVRLLDSVNQTRLCGLL